MNPPPIRNMGASSIQLTADQILKDAQIHRQTIVKPPLITVMDQKQLLVYTQQKRRFFEDKLRRQRYNLSTWVRYAQWQQNLKQFSRARSVFERALQIDYTNKSLWLKYAQMQMRNKFVNHARNVWQRACYYLPRQDQFWFKYAYMQQLLGQYIKARQIFTRWLQYFPPEKAYDSFIKFQQRMGQHQRARKIMYKYLQDYPTLHAYLKIASQQQKNRKKQAARNIYQRIIIDLGAQAIKQQYFLKFAKFQTKNKQYQRAREIYKFGLSKIQKSQANKLYTQYLAFQKQFGTKQQIDGIIIIQRRNIYKNLLSKNQLNYDAWIDLIFLQQSAATSIISDNKSTKQQIKKSIDIVRQTYNAATKVLPPTQQKRFWRRYIYLWLNWAVFQQTIANDNLEAQKIYQRAISIIPHKKFTFGKLWINYANFQLRCNNLQKMRKIYGMAIGKHPKQKIFRAYIAVQQQLCQLDRVRMIYQRYCQKFSNLSSPWLDFATFQLNLQQVKRAKDILNIAQQLNIEGIPDPQQFISQFNNRKQQQQNQQ